MILPATATLATASHCSAVETSPSMPGPSNKCDFGASEDFKGKKKNVK